MAVGLERLGIIIHLSSSLFILLHLCKATIILLDTMILSSKKLSSFYFFFTTAAMKLSLVCSISICDTPVGRIKTCDPILSTRSLSRRHTIAQNLYCSIDTFIYHQIISYTYLQLLILLAFRRWSPAY